MPPSPYDRGLGLRGHEFSGPPLRSLSLRPGDSLTVPWMALSMGFKYSVSLLPAIQATGPLALTLARLTLAEHASLGWTHDHTFNLLESLRRKDNGKIAAIVKISLNTIFQSPSYRNYFVKWSKLPYEIGRLSPTYLPPIKITYSKCSPPGKIPGVCSLIKTEIKTDHTRYRVSGQVYRKLSSGPFAPKFHVLIYRQYIWAHGKADEI